MSSRANFHKTTAAMTQSAPPAAQAVISPPPSAATASYHPSDFDLLLQRITARQQSGSPVPPDNLLHQKPHDDAANTHTRPLEIDAISAPGSGVTVMINGSKYLVQLDKFRYFAHKRHFEALRDGVAEESIQCMKHMLPIAFFPVIREVVHSGAPLHRYFQLMKPNLEHYHQLCDSLRYLTIDVVGKRTMLQVIHEIGKRHETMDSAFRVVYMLLLGDEDVVRNEDADAIYSGIRYITDRPAKFSANMRLVMQKAANDRLILTKKQREGLAGTKPPRWHNKSRKGTKAE